MSALVDAPRLTRAALHDRRTASWARAGGAAGNANDQPPAPARIVHLGLGGFHRAHQAWYTAHAADAAGWGIVAFSGHSTGLAATLADQDGLYTLITRAADADVYEVVRSIVATGNGADGERFARALADPEVAILTSTVTEAAYRLAGDGSLDLTDAATAADIKALRAVIAGRPGPAPSTVLGRILLGCHYRRLAPAKAPGLAIAPADNLPRNGATVVAALQALADEVDPSLAQWLRSGVSPVSSSVDRITPRATDADREAVLAATGLRDLAPVVTEPFSDWVLAGEFPAGRPDWGSAGARFVTDIEPWEHRKLWLLNGAHTLLAALGSLRGHTTVAQAIADPVCRDAVQALWDDAQQQLPDLDIVAYRAALLERFANPRIEHRLAQIAEDSLVKLRLRIVPVARAQRAAARDAGGCATAIAAWLLAKRASSSPGERATLAEIDPDLAADASFSARVADATTEL